MSVGRRQIAILIGCWWCWSTAWARPGDPPVIVRGATACPTPNEIGAALVGLLPRHGSQAEPDVLQVLGGEESGGNGGASGERIGTGTNRAGAGTLRLVLNNAAGELIARRSVVAGAASCDERARTIAVVVAAWEARMQAGTHPSMPAIALAAAALPALTADGRTIADAAVVSAGATVRLPAEPAPASGPPGPPDSAAVAPTPPATIAPPSSGPDSPTSTSGGGAGRPADFAESDRSSSAVEVETGAAFLGSVTGGSVAPGALAEVAVSRGGSPWLSLGLGVLAIGTHAVVLTDTGTQGRGAWHRVGGVIDLRSRSTRWRAFELDLRAGLALTALAIRGQSLPFTAGATLFDPGLLAGVRVRTRLGQVAPFLELAGAMWPRTHTMYLGNSTFSTDLPAIEGWLAIGLSLVGDRARDR